MTQYYNGHSYWVHDLDPFIFRFSENFGLRWYGLAYALGFMAGAWMLSLYFKKKRSPFNPDQQFVMLVALILGTLLGGRLGYMLLYDFHNFIRNPLIIADLSGGGINGMASHGGITGLALAAIWIGHHYKLSPFKVGDLVVSVGGLGIFFGRIANFINGELYGRVAEVPWAIIFPTGGLAPRHPYQLYAALLEGLMVFAYAQLRFWKSDICKRFPGHLVGEFFLVYALGRIIGECFREPDAGIVQFFGINRGMFYSFFMVLVGVVFILWARRKQSPS